jgi:heptosyltransferase I
VVLPAAAWYSTCVIDDAVDHGAARSDRPSGARIGIVMLTAAGDAVHVLPVLNALKRQDPTRRLTWIVQPGPAALVRGHPAVDELLVFERRQGWRAWAALRRALAARPFDLVLDLQVYLKASAVTLLASAPVKLGFDRARARDFNWLATTHRIPAHAPQHVQDQYFEFLDALGVPPEPVEWRLGPWPEERERQRAFASRFDRPIVSLVIGSTHREKEWLPERWAELAEALYRDVGLAPVLAGGTSARERQTEQGVRAATNVPIVSTLGVPLRELVSVLDASALVVSLDTAPLHMAVALERPVVSLMGYNNPKRVGPYRRYADLIVDAYGDPGEDYPVSIAHRAGRMPRISVRDVLERVERWQRTYRDARAST